MKKKLKILIYTVSLFSLFISVSHVMAHTLETEGTFGAVLHIDPDDDPIIGQPAYFFLDFKDKISKFTAESCMCTVTITENGKTIFTDNLIKDESDKNSMHFSFTFPRKDRYSVKVTGKSLNNSFQAFSFTYDLHIERQAEKHESHGNSHFLEYVLTIIIGGLVLIYIILNKFKKNADINEK